MNITKIKVLLALSFVICIGLLAHNVSQKLSLHSLESTLTHQFKITLQAYGYTPENISINSANWAGFRHPLSIELQEVSVHDNAYSIEIKKLRLGVDLLKLLRFNPHIKNISIKDGTLKKDSKIIAHLSGGAHITGSLIRYKITELTCIPKDLTPLNSQLDILHTFDIPIQLKSTGQFDYEADIEGTLDLKLDRGSFQFPPFYTDPVEITHGEISATLQSNSLIIEDLNLTSKSIQTHLSGKLSAPSLVTAIKTQAPLAVEAQGYLTDLSVDQIQAYWPISLGEKARKWVTTNLSKGAVSKATLDLTGTLIMDPAEPSFTIKNLGGQIDAHGVDVAYIDGLPKVTNSTGSCIYTKDTFKISAHGDCDGMKVEDAQLVMSKLDTSNEHMDINLTVIGSLEKALNLIAQPPLLLPQKLGLDASIFKGIANTQLHLSFPLIENLALEKVQAKAASSLDNVKLTLKNLPSYFATPVTQGKFDLSVTNQEIHLDGVAKAMGHTAKISGGENFDTKKQALQISAEDEKQDPYLGKFDLTYKNGKIFGQADLTKLEYSIPSLQFIKEKKQPGSLVLEGSLDQTSRLNLSKLELRLNNAKILASGEISQKGLKDFKLTQVSVGDLHGHFTANGGLNRIILDGEIKDLDLSPILLELKNLKPTSDDLNLLARLKINKLHLADKFNFGDVNSSLTWEKGELSSLAIVSAAPSALDVHISPATNKVHSMSLSCANVGGLIDHFNPGSDFEGGTLTFVGNLKVGRDSPTVIGDIDIRQLTAIKAPLLAKILSVSSLDGILRTLTGQGIHFDHTIGKVKWSPDSIEFEDLHASGSSIALNLNGTIGNSYNLQGELYPLNSINHLIANIPMIGSILSGGTNRGIISTGFTVTGSANSPEIKVNPLSTIALQGVKELAKAVSKQQAAQTHQKLEASPAE